MMNTDDTAAEEAPASSHVRFITSALSLCKRVDAGTRALLLTKCRLKIANEPATEDMNKEDVFFNMEAAKLSSLSS